MMKERAMAIFIGLLMIFSVAGFAIMGINFGGGNSGQQVQTPSVVDRALTRDEFRSVLMSGKTIIQNHYIVGCTDCDATSSLLAGFAQQMEGFIVLEQFGVQFQNETRLQVVSSDGKITELNSSALSQESLLDTICSVSYVQPKQCLLRGIGQTEPAAAPPAAEPAANETQNGAADNIGNVTGNGTGNISGAEGNATL